MSGGGRKWGRGWEKEGGRKGGGVEGVSGGGRKWGRE